MRGNLKSVYSIIPTTIEKKNQLSYITKAVTQIRNAELTIIAT